MVIITEKAVPTVREVSDYMGSPELLLQAIWKRTRRFSASASLNIRGASFERESREREAA